MLKPFIDPATHKKISFVVYDPPKPPPAGATAVGMDVGGDAVAVAGSSGGSTTAAAPSASLGRGSCGSSSSGGSSKMVDFLSVLMDEGMVSWVLREAAAVRAWALGRGKAGKPPRPTYDLRELRFMVAVAAGDAGAAAAGDAGVATAEAAVAGNGGESGGAGIPPVMPRPSAAPGLLAAALAAPHSHYGSRSFLQFLADHPKVMTAPALQ